MQYKVCSSCGAPLDFGEICDFQNEEKKAAPPQPERPQAKIPTVSLPIWPGKVKVRGCLHG